VYVLKGLHYLDNTYLFITLQAYDSLALPMASALPSLSPSTSLLSNVLGNGQADTTSLHRSFAQTLVSVRWPQFE
jgi:hypothetical protein